MERPSEVGGLGNLDDGTLAGIILAKIALVDVALDGLDDELGQQVDLAVSELDLFAPGGGLDLGSDEAALRRSRSGTTTTGNSRPFEA